MRTEKLLRCFCLLAVLCGLPWLVSAQTLPENRIVLSVVPNAKEIKLTFKLASGATEIPIDFGKGEQSTAIAYKPTGDYGMTLVYPFKQTSASEREVVITASDLLSLRVVNATAQINGIKEVIAPKLENLFADNTSLEAYSTLDLRKAPKLQAISMTYTGLEHVMLAPNNQLTSIAISPTLAEKKYLRSINVEDSPKLTQLSIGNHQLEKDTLDLRRCKALQILNVAGGVDTKELKRSRLRALLGIKDLRLERFLGQNNELGFDQLPDRPEDIPLEQYMYGNQRNYRLHSRYIKGLTVNLSHLYKARGIQTAISLTTYEWVYQDGEKDGKPNYVTIPKEKITVKNGSVFTFDESILRDGIAKVYFRAINDGYPGVGRYDTKAKTYSNKLISYIITLQKEKPERITLQTNLSASKKLNLRLASADGRAKIQVGGQVIERTDLSTDIKKATPVSIDIKESKPTITLEGALTMLDCSGASLSALDVSEARSLTLLDCSRNELTKLDASQCQDLVYLYAMENALDTATLASLPQLEELNLSFNQLTALDLSGLPQLTSISVDKNQIAGLDLSKNTNLTKLYCKANGLPELSLAGLNKLMVLSCEANKLVSLDLSQCPDLELLFCKSNKLTNLDLMRTPKLREINVAVNKLKALSTKSLPQLSELYCWSNEIASLDLTSNKQLSVVSAGDNQLTEVKIENLPALASLSLSANKLERLSVAGCAALEAMDVFLNKISLSALQDLIKSLPNRGAKEQGSLIYHNKAEYPDETEYNEVTPELVSQAKEKNWVMLDGEKPLPQGIDAPDQESLRIYPTVVDQTLYVQGQYSAARLYTLEGKLVGRLADGASSWDLSSLPVGHYIISCTLQGGSTQAFRIEVKR